MTVLFAPEASNQLGAMAGAGHEERFPPTMLGAGYRFRKETIAGMRPTGEMADSGHSAGDDLSPRVGLGADLRIRHEFEPSGVDPVARSAGANCRCR